MSNKISIWEKFINKFILRNFFKINLTSIESEIAVESVREKYAPCLKVAIINGLLVLPAILFLDSSTITSVLIPITLVAGTAWYSISLSSIKKKFENFGLDLTTNIFESFVTSLVVLILIATISLTSNFLTPIMSLSKYTFITLTSGILGSFIIFKTIYKVFIGSMKYDINDAMLTGQNEAAEKFFKKSLSFLNITAENLRSGKHIQVANYYIGLSFFEIFTYIKSLNIFNNDEISKYIDKANVLIDEPSMKQKEADKISVALIEEFLSLIKMKNNSDVNKSIQAIKDELRNLSDEDSVNEVQEMVDTRMSIIFQEIGNMIDNAGEGLFKDK